MDVADHLGTLVIDVANSLAVLAHSGRRAHELLADGSRIQRMIGELHGAQRQRLGWGEAQLGREVDLVREVCLGAAGPRSPADDEARARGGRLGAGAAAGRADARLPERLSRLLRHGKLSA